MTGVQQGSVRKGRQRIDVLLCRGPLGRGEERMECYRLSEIGQLEALCGTNLNAVPWGERLLVPRDSRFLCH